MSSPPREKKGIVISSYCTRIKPVHRIRDAENNKYPVIMPNVDSDTRRGDDSILAVLNRWRNEVAGPRGKQDRIFYFFRGPQIKIPDGGVDYAWIRQERANRSGSIDRWSSRTMQ